MATKDTNYLVAVHKDWTKPFENRLQLCGEIQQAEIFTELHDGSARTDKLISQNAKHRPLCEHS